MHVLYTSPRSLSSAGVYELVVFVSVAPPSGVMLKTIHPDLVVSYCTLLLALPMSDCSIFEQGS